jgi:hypothetical protein
MAITLDATIATETANSFCDLPFADDYFTNHYSVSKSSLWNTLSDEQKAQLLVLAASVINTAKFTDAWEQQHYSLVSNPSDPTRFVSIPNTEYAVKYTFAQRLQFPRNLDIKQDGTVFMPPEIQFAQCEQAVYMAALDESALESQAQGLRHESLGVGGQVSLSQSFTGAGTAFAPMALHYMNEFMIKNSTRLTRA